MGATPLPALAQVTGRYTDRHHPPDHIDWPVAAAEDRTGVCVFQPTNPAR